MIQAYNEGQDNKGYLVLYQLPGPDGSESLSSKHAAHIAAAAAEHAEAIGTNFNDELLEWEQGYMLSNDEKEHQDRYEQFAQQQESDAEVAGHPNLEDLCCAIL